MEKRKRKRIKNNRPVRPIPLTKDQTVLEIPPKYEATQTSNSEYHPKQQLASKTDEKRPWAKDIKKEERGASYKAFMRYWLKKAAE